MTDEEFDYTLIDGFFNSPDAPMNRLICGKVEEHKHLKRMYHPYYSNWSITRYICDRMPKLANVLWKNSKKDAKRIAKILSKSDLMPIPFSQAEVDKRREGYGRSLRQKYTVDSNTKGAIIRNTRNDGVHGWRVCS